MSNELDHIQYSPIRNYRYEQWFEELQHYGKEFDAEIKGKFVKMVDEDVADYSEGLQMVKSMFENNKNKHDEFHDAYSVVLSVMQFILVTMADSMVITKYFVLADKDYDRRFMRGKMRIILNEGFKKLYGFKEGKKKSEWIRLAPILKYFPEDIQHQYQHLTFLLENHSESSSWWWDERNVETHLDANKLYESRCEDIVESKVMMDSLKLFDTLFAVECFLSNMHACFRNSLVDMYQRGELKEEQFK